MRKVGTTCSYPNGRRPDDGSRALGELKFQVYDVLLKCIISPIFFAPSLVCVVSTDRRLLGCGHILAVVRSIVIS